MRLRFLSSYFPLISGLYKSTVCAQLFQLKVFRRGGRPARPCFCVSAVGHEIVDFIGEVTRENIGLECFEWRFIHLFE